MEPKKLRDALIMIKSACKAQPNSRLMDTMIGIWAEEALSAAPDEPQRDYTPDIYELKRLLEDAVQYVPNGHKTPHLPYAPGNLEWHRSVDRILAAFAEADKQEGK